jgi:RHS repeat-associated protein
MGAPPTPGTGQKFYYHADGEGSIRPLTDALGNIANGYEYDSYGRRLTNVEAVLQSYGWKGREFLPGPDIYYNRARFYDPVLGRFMSEDPLGYSGGDFNLYSFAWTNPKNWNDPSGLSAAAEEAGLSAGAIIAAPAERAVGCALSTVMFEAALAVDGADNIHADGTCGATGTLTKPRMLCARVC